MMRGWKIMQNLNIALLTMEDLIDKQIEAIINDELRIKNVSGLLKYREVLGNLKREYILGLNLLKSNGVYIWDCSRIIFLEDYLKALDTLIANNVLKEENMEMILQYLKAITINSYGDIYKNRASDEVKYWTQYGAIIGYADEVEVIAEKQDILQEVLARQAANYADYQEALQFIYGSVLSYKKVR